MSNLIQEVEAVEQLPVVFTEQEIDNYLLMVFSKMFTTQNMSLTYHYRIAETLYQGVLRGYGKTIAEAVSHSPHFKALTKMRENVYFFSAAKQYQQIRTMGEFITSKGEVSTFEQFRRLASKVFVEFNDTWLRTEYNTSIRQAQTAREWIDLEENKDVNPMVEYRTQLDSHVRDAHAALHGIALPIDHPFWTRNTPPNDWNCRCFIVAHGAEKGPTRLKKVDLSDLSDAKKFPPQFRHNPGKTHVVFAPNHPYFSVPRKDKELKKQGFKMPIP
jgi:SPP1 gp7 family putative phage head morphogenesis protein